MSGRLPKSWFILVQDTGTPLPAEISCIDFRGLTIEYIGEENTVRVTSSGSGGAVTWGSITGTLSSQTDLQSALNDKANTSALATVATSGAYSDLTGRPTLGTLASQDGTFSAKQDTLVSGTNIKTVNGTSLLGSGNVVVSGSAAATTVEQDLGSTPTWRGKFTITDAAITAASKILCWQAPGPYTGKGTCADEAEMQPVQVTAVVPSSGEAVVYWQTPPMVAMVKETQQGRRNTVGATFDRVINQLLPEVFTPQRLGKVRGNIKFSYTLFT